MLLAIKALIWFAFLMATLMMADVTNVAYVFFIGEPIVLLIFTLRHKLTLIIRKMVK